MRMLGMILVTWCSLLMASLAHADNVEDVFRANLSAGTYEQGAAALASLSAVDPARAAAAAGMLRFAGAIEHLGQAFYRHGLSAPASNRGGMMMLPVLRMPVPLNPNPERLDYAGFRSILETLVRDLDAAEQDMSRLGDSDFKLPVDLATVAFDFNRNGKQDAGEKLVDILAVLMGPADGPAPATMLLKWDTADVYWLRGYGRFVSAFAQFMLAHDFQPTFDKTFHVFFPKAGLPLGDALAANRAAQEMADAALGDGIAFLHLLNWEVKDRARLDDARLRLAAMTELSPLSWKAARAETDNDGEWLPNAKQTQAFTGSTSEDQVIDGWLAVMGELHDVLEGRKLVPHWRFDKGLNLKAYLDGTPRFDLVLLLAGTDAVQWLEDGPVSDSMRWNELMSTFRGNFLGYALWYN